MKITILTLFFGLLVGNSYQRSSPTSDNYVAAVVEFSPDDPTSPEDPPIRSNALRYVPFIEKAAKENVDIIVFPEDGLTSVHLPERTRLDTWTTIVPSPSAHYVPCIHSTIAVSETMKDISCSARDNMIYVVINIAEKVVCTNKSCPNDQRLFYNTNVVFDREGKIIARYRKTNLFLESQFNTTKIPEVVTFETDFGVTFGTFTCFDILFKEPAMYLTRILNVTDVIFPTAWFSELPFLTALQTQAGWAYAGDVNLLASGYNKPVFGNTGSGIFLGRQGMAKGIMSTSAESKLLIAKVPKKNLTSIYHRTHPRYNYTLEEAALPINEKHPAHDELRRKRSVDLESLKIHTDLRKKRSAAAETSKIVDGENGGKLSLFHEDLSPYKSHRFNSSINRSLCDGDFCCNFNVEMTSVDQEAHYRMLVYDGTRKFPEPVTAGIRVCAIVFCSNDTLDSCGDIEKSANTFKVLTIYATFPNYEDVLVMPTSLAADFHPLSNWGYEERWEEKILHVTANLASPINDIVTCGIYARDFSRDSRTEEDDSKIGMQWATLTALAIVSLFLLFLYRKGWRKPWQRDNQLSSDAGPYRSLQSR